MRHAMRKLWNNTGGAIWRCLNRLVRPLGVVILPVGVIDTMEAEGNEAASYRKHRQLCRQDDGYFNGISDALTKKAKTLREHYLPNK
tara:strand:+ start:220 stop:480 length:261 start_codon:yes stop_codon:yes gene_type:complete